MPDALGVYVLNSSILALEPDVSTQRFITIPSGSLVRTISVGPDKAGLIAVSVGAKSLKLFLVDLQERAEKIAEQSA